MSTLETNAPAGFQPEPLSSRIFVRCYRHYGDANHAYDQLRVVAGIPDKRMTVVARGLEWHEPLRTASLLKLASGVAAALGGVVGILLWTLGLTGAHTGWLAQTVLGALAGALVGMVAAGAVAWLRGARAGLAQTGHVEPYQYDILVEEDLAPAAREVLGED